MNDFLTAKEHDGYMTDFTDIVSSTIDNIISLADKHNVDRNNAMEHFAKIFSSMVEISTFEKYGALIGIDNK